MGISLSNIFQSIGRFKIKANFSRKFDYQKRSTMNPKVLATIVTLLAIFCGKTLGCEPYSEEACLEAVKNLPNLQFVEKGDFDTKGCYYYKTGAHSGKAWFDTGGSLDQRKNHPTEAGQFRPKGYDCKSVEPTWCTGTYEEHWDHVRSWGKRPDAGTKCLGECKTSDNPKTYYDDNINSWCYVKAKISCWGCKKNKHNWGADCVPC